MSLRVAAADQQPEPDVAAEHAWFVATEVDLPWTGIGGSAALLEDLLSTEGLDVELTDLSQHPLSWCA